MKLQRVQPDFTVVVTHRNNPIAGIEVIVHHKGIAEPVFTGESDESGSVRVTNLAAGEYFVSASHDGIEAPKQWIEIVAVPQAKAKARIDFQWADWSYTTRRIAGTLTGLVPGNTGNPLMDIVHPKQTVFPGVEISLRNAFGIEKYRTFSDSNGRFVFDNLPDAIYVMTIQGGMKSLYGTGADTKLVIDVAAASSRDFLPLSLQDNGCYSIEFVLHEN